ncbi:hypothetical protein Y1Q_0015152 [Alligator mississippiensis]|uniref:Uncharacterized protein n=1 Tax=Alligator mississippiensis TaxID=8496 RepID=A0A151P8Y7_ALLMI|nr:hypothetical protein Y1Q_0015152 [Alligator mississippiensis]
MCGGKKKPQEEPCTTFRIVQCEFQKVRCLPTLGWPYLGSSAPSPCGVFFPASLFWLHFWSLAVSSLGFDIVPLPAGHIRDPVLRLRNFF